VQCKHTTLAADAKTKDGCCPKGLSLSEDADCLPTCNPDSAGNCVDLCKDVTCPDGQYCVSGTCKPWPKTGDGGAYPAGVDGGSDPQNPQNPAGNGEDWIENGGCACHASDGPFFSFVLLLLGLLWRWRIS